MTTNSPKESYEAAILQPLIKNSEDIATMKQDMAQIRQDVDQIKEEVSQIKQDLEQIKKDIGLAKMLLWTIAIGVLVNIISPPIVSLFN